MRRGGCSRVTLNIRDEPGLEKVLFDETQRATFNILEDLTEERERFELTQRATFNILDDLNAEKARLEMTQKAMLNLLDDLTQEKDKVASSLAEKDVLLREIHHRVKNNLQVTSGLLHLQSKHARDEETRELFVESMSRVKSMALVHEKLYESVNLSAVDFAEYVRDLVRELVRLYGAAERHVNVETNIPPISIELDACVNLGLIINELVSNALKHAFPNGREGHVWISLAPAGEGELCLSVRDDGVGLGPDLNIAAVRTMGLQLVAGLTKQIDGSLEVERTNGTDFRITFHGSRAEGDRP